jgi:hypothetical protein
MREFLLLAAIAVAAGCDTQPKIEGRSYPLAPAEARAPWPGNSGHVYTTRHYRIYTTAKRAELVDRLPGFMEAANQHYRELTGLGDDAAGTMPVYMFGSRGEWSAMTARIIQGPSAGLYQNIQAGGYCYAGVCVFWDLGGLHTYSVASHEGMHQFFSTRLRHRLPSFLEEGLCTLTEGLEMDATQVRFTPDRNVARFNDLRRGIVNGQWVPLEKLLTMDAGDAVSNPQGATEYYGQLWALALYLRAEPAYRQGLSRWLADAREGKTHEALKMTPQQLAAAMASGREYNKKLAAKLFAAYIDADFARFDAGFRKFASRQAGL